MYSHPDPKIRNTQIALHAEAVAQAEKQHPIAVLSSTAAKQKGLAVLTTELTADGIIQITPDGYFKASDGRPFELPRGWLMNQQVADRLLAMLAQRTNKIVIDYEHQTLLAETNGQPAPAAGWVEPSDIEYRPGQGLFSKCKWTAKAKEMIDGGEYLYLSPVFSFHPETGEVLELMHIAITNAPAVDGMDTIEALRKKHQSSLTVQPEENTVDRNELIELLGLPADATDAQIQVALKAHKAATDKVAALNKALGVEEGGDAVAAVAALKAKPADEQPNPEKYVSVDVVEGLKTEIAALKQKNTDTEVDALVAQGIEDGKLLPVQEDWAKTLGKSSVASLKAYLEKTPAIAALKEQQTQGKKPAADNQPQLNDEAVAVCKQLGITAEEYLAANPEEN